jgi:hypothetical protein
MDSYADALGAIGRLLDAEEGGPLALLWVGDTITLLSQNSGASVSDPLRRVLTREELEPWREAPGASHEADVPRLSAGRADLLRTLGRELTADGLGLVGLIESEDRFEVRAEHHGRYFQRMYLKSTLAVRWAQGEEPAAAPLEHWRQMLVAAAALVVVALAGGAVLTQTLTPVASAPSPVADSTGAASEAGPAAAAESRDVEATTASVSPAEEPEIIGPVLPAATSVPVAAPPTAIVSTQVVVVTSSGLRLRAQPLTTGALITGLTTGTRLEVLGDPVTADGYTWLEVRTPNGSQGWVVAPGVS